MTSLPYSHLLLIVILACVIVQPSPAQDRDGGIERNESTGKFEFRTVVEGPGDADELFRLSNLWLVRNIADSDSALEYESEANRSLAGKVAVPVIHNAILMHADTMVKALLQIDCRDQRCRLVFTDLVYSFLLDGDRFETPFEDRISRGKGLREKTKEAIDLLIEDYSLALQPSDEDW